MNETKWHGDDRRKEELEEIERRLSEAEKETLGGQLQALREANKALFVDVCEFFKIDKLCDFINKKLKKEK